MVFFLFLDMLYSKFTRVQKKINTSLRFSANNKSAKPANALLKNYRWIHEGTKDNGIPNMSFNDLVEELEKKKKEGTHTSLFGDVDLEGMDVPELSKVDVPMNVSEIVDHLKSGKAESREIDYLNALFVIIVSDLPGQIGSFLEYRGLELIVKYIDKNYSEDIRKVGLMIFYSLASHESLLESVSKMDICESVFELINSRNAEVCLSAAELMSLLLESKEYESRSFEAEKIKQIIDALDRFKETPDTVNQLMGVLFILSANDKYKPIYKEVGALKVISDILTQGDSFKEAKLTAVLFLANQGVDGDTTQIQSLIECGAIKNLCLELFSQTNLNYGTQKAIIRCLEYATLSESLSETFGRLGYIKRFIKILKNHIELSTKDAQHGRNKSVHNHTHFFSMLSNLSRNIEANKIELFDSGVIYVVLNYVKRHETALTPSEKVAIISLLFNLSTIDGCKVEMQSQGCVDSLVKFLQTDDNTVINLLSASLLLRLCDIHGGQDDILHSPFFSFIFPKIVKYQNPETRITIGNIITKLLTGNIRLLVHEKLCSINGALQAMVFLATKDPSPEVQKVFGRNLSLVQALVK